VLLFFINKGRYLSKAFMKTCFKQTKQLEKKEKLLLNLRLVLKHEHSKAEQKQNKKVFP